MLRRLYAFFLRLHPQAFRERFQDEMQWIFDESPKRRTRFWLVADVLASVLRQRIFRSPDEGATGAASQAAVDGTPLFVAVDVPMPVARILVRGSIFTLATWTVFSLGMQASRQYSPSIIWEVASRPRPASIRLIPLHAPSHTGTGDHNEPRSKPDSKQSFWSSIPAFFAFEFLPRPDAKSSPWQRPESGSQLELLRSLPSSRATLHLPPRVPKRDPLVSHLDSDGDLTVSAAEIRRSPQSLLRLDANRDGKLTRAECGLRNGLAASRIFEALDRDRDGELSAKEIGTASQVLSQVVSNASL